MPVPPLTATAELARLRQKYPDGLWCTNPEPCDHRLLATTAAGWAKSWPPDERLARRDTFICADCTQRAGERERVAAVRRQNLAKNLEGMRAQVLVEEPQPPRAQHA